MPREEAGGFLGWAADGAIRVVFITDIWTAFALLWEEVVAIALVGRVLPKFFLARAITSGDRLREKLAYFFNAS